LFGEDILKQKPEDFMHDGMSSEGKFGSNVIDRTGGHPIRCYEILMRTILDEADDTDWDVEDKMKTKDQEGIAGLDFYSIVIYTLLLTNVNVTSPGGTIWLPYVLYNMTHLFSNLPPLVGSSKVLK
jgi:hypothetical protein